MSDGKVVFDITGSTSGIDGALNAATNTISRQTAKWTVLGQTAMNGLVSAVKAGMNGIRALWDNAFEYNAQMETYEVNFKTLLGSAEAAQAKITELKQYAVKTPFAFTDLAQATQTLLAFDVSSEDAALSLKHLGDISLGDANKLQSLTLAFGQVSSAGKLAGQDLLQMINAGFNPLNVIAQETGAAYADLKAVMSGEKTSEDFQLRMEAARKEVEELGTSASQGAIMLAQIGKDGMISADMVAAAMRIATSEGGAFYKALESASQTAQGQISTIQDSWDTLSGKVTGSAFEKLSTDVFPKVIGWLDELNAAFDENGFTGLKTAADRILGEIGAMAFDLGSRLLTKIYNGLTGDTKTPEEIKAYMTEIFGAASDAVDNIKDVGLSVLEWIRDNGELVGAAATTIGVGLGIFALLSNPLSGVLAAIAGALLIFTTDWEKFEEKYPNIVKAFEDITGIEFDDFVEGVSSAKDKLSAFYTGVLVPLFDWLSEHGEALQLALAGIGIAMMLSGHVVGGLSLLLGVVLTNWEDIKTAVDNAVTAVETFFTQTIPSEWNQFVDDVKKIWQDNVCTPIDNAALAVADFFGIKVPDGWSLTKTIGEAWDKLTQKINAVIQTIAEFFGLETTLLIGTEDPNKGAGVHTTSSGRLAGHAFRSFGGNDDISTAVAGLDDEGVKLPVSWNEDAEITLQSELDNMNLSTTAEVQLIPDTALFSDRFPSLKPNFGNTGQSHASGGLFTAATRFLGADGMHTFGESGTEALLPLDTLWRRMGMIFDQSLSSNLAGLQYAVMPQLPAASPVPFDEDALSEKIAAAVREAVTGLSIDMDRRTVAHIIKNDVSKEIANDVNSRRWTS